MKYAILFAISFFTTPMFVMVHGELTQDDTGYVVVWNSDDWILVQDPYVASHHGFAHASAVGGGSGEGVISGDGTIIVNLAWVSDNRCFSNAAMSVSTVGYTNGSWLAVDGADKVVKGHWHGHAEGSLAWTGGDASGDYALLQSTTLPSTWVNQRDLSVSDQGGTEYRAGRSMTLAVGGGRPATATLPEVDGGSEGESDAIPYDSGPIPIKDCDNQFDMQLNVGGSTTLEADGGCWQQPAMISSDGWAGIQLDIELLGSCPVGWPSSGPSRD